MSKSTHRLRRFASLLAVAATATAGGLAGGATAAHANIFFNPNGGQIGPGTVFTMTFHNGDALSVNGSLADDAPVVQEGLNSFDFSQEWTYVPQSNDTWELVNEASGKCLSVYYNSTAAGAGLVQYACHGWADQQWTPVLDPHSTQGNWMLQSKSSGLVMNDPQASVIYGTQMVQWPADTAGLASWVELNAVSRPAPPVDASHAYRITTANSLAFDVPAYSKAPDTPVTQYGVNLLGDHSNQDWVFRPQASGSYEIMSLTSGQCLSVYYNSTSAGAGLVQYPCYGMADQQWLVKTYKDNAVFIQSVSSRMLVDVPQDTPVWGTQLVQWPSNGGINQIFTLTQDGLVYVS